MDSDPGKITALHTSHPSSDFDHPVIYEKTLPETAHTNARGRSRKWLLYKLLICCFGSNRFKEETPNKQIILYGYLRGAVSCHDRLVFILKMAPHGFTCAPQFLFEGIHGVNRS